MTKKKKILIFSTSALLLAVLALLCLLVINSANKPDKNGMFKIDDMYFEAQKDISEEAALRFAKKILSIKDSFLSDKNRTFYTIVPDKSFYIQGGKYPTPSYQAALATAQGALSADKSLEYIDLTLSLTLDDYYITDPHWRQERLGNVVKALGDRMGFVVDLTSLETKTLDNFIGSYGKNLPSLKDGEPLNYLTGPIIENAICEVFTTKDFEKMPVYRIDKFTGKVPYDVFLYGATPLVRLYNTNATSDKELIIFRDSYASSLAPLLISEYANITLIDLRYMASQILPDYVDIQGQDVLFMYSTAIMANSAILR